ncbi:hypothetical protein DVS28_a2317 [Euzebya pacifica]|uniref:Uncharacterized protein n=1 Tax=Euzebya pacifica TaxID=1608957 RepID=A0A346XXQ2_9ACTN|nr:hypothetical protein [Euzebya pacifica]AXV06999.1 hypothetical protein DVS28_a2317 [Euzebya pacifica]
MDSRADGTAARSVLRYSRRRVQRMLGTGAGLLLVGAILVAGGNGGLRDPLGQLVGAIGAIVGYGASRYWWSLRGLSAGAGLEWTLTLTTLPAGELPTGTARVRPLRPWLPGPLDNARPRVVVAERYPNPPSWWQGQRFGFGPMARWAQAGARVAVRSAPAGDRILVGPPGHAGVVLRRIADPQLPEARRRDLMIGRANRISLTGAVGVALVRLVESVGLPDRLDALDGPLSMVGTLAAIALVIGVTWRIALMIRALQEDRAVVDPVATTLAR